MKRAVDCVRLGWTWPIPFWLLFITFLIVPVGVGITGLQVREWSFISLSHISGLARESFTISGPLVCAVAAHVTGILVNPLSPATIKNAPLRATVLPRRIMVWLTTSVLAGYALGCMVLLAVAAPIARAGSVNWPEVLFSPLQLIAITLLGVLIGFLVNGRWWSAPLAALIVIGWIVALPMLVGGVLPSYEYSVGHEFLFPATPAFRHEPYAGIRTFPLIVLWILIIVLCAACVRLVAARQGRDHFPIVIPLVTAAGFVAMLVAVVVDSRPFYASLAPVESVCQTKGEWEFCVAKEEEQALREMIEGAQAPIEKAGALAQGHHKVITTTLWLSQGQPDAFAEPTIIAGVSDVSGAKYAHRDIASYLSGLSVCVANNHENDPDFRALTLTRWIAEEAEGPVVDDLGQFLSTASEEEIQRWLALNKEYIATCSLGGVPIP